jgi:hypothetical protein
VAQWPQVPKVQSASSAALGAVPDPATDLVAPGLHKNAPGLLCHACRAAARDESGEGFTVAPIDATVVGGPWRRPVP